MRQRAPCGEKISMIAGTSTFSQAGVQKLMRLRGSRSRSKCGTATGTSTELAKCINNRTVGPINASLGVYGRCHGGYLQTFDNGLGCLSCRDCYFYQEVRSAECATTRGAEHELSPVRAVGVASPVQSGRAAAALACLGLTPSHLRGQGCGCRRRTGRRRPSKA